MGNPMSNNSYFDKRIPHHNGILDDFGTNHGVSLETSQPSIPTYTVARVLRQ